MDEQKPTNHEGTPAVPPAAPQPTPAPQQPQPEHPQAQATAPTAAPKHNTLMAVVAYILFFVPLLTEAKNDPFVKFHVKQGLVLFIACVASAIFIRLPIIGWILMVPLNVFLFVIWIMGILNALSGKQKHLPLIGEYGDSFQF